MKTLLILAVLLLLTTCNKSVGDSCEECKVNIPTYEGNSTKPFKIRN